jgi:hypothetical protein
MYPSALLGMVKSHRSEMSCNRVARLVLEIKSHQYGTSRHGFFIDLSYLCSFFNSTAFSASALSAVFLVAACKL